MAKMSLQEDWIRDLTVQNEMLVKAVEELEQEATDRVLALEQKLKETSKCACEVMNGYNYFSVNLEEAFQGMEKLRSDVINLVEYLKRIRNNGNWCTDGLTFQTVDLSDFVGKCKDEKLCPVCKCPPCDDKSKDTMKEKDAKLKELQEKLKQTEQTLANENYEALKQSMLDMRDALTAEVADKHDMILSLRRDVQLLEDQCRKADQQTHFKDDIIKELRKEIKQLKQEKKLSKPKRPKSISPMRSRTHEITLPTYKDITRFNCPIKSHKNIEKYRDCQSRVVIFVCEDSKEKEVQRVFNGSTFQMVYRNPKVVHECCASILESYERCGDFHEEPEKLEKDLNYKENKETSIPMTTQTDGNGTFEIINSHPSKPRKSQIPQLQRKKPKNVNCFSCVIEPDYIDTSFGKCYFDSGDASNKFDKRNFLRYHSQAEDTLNSAKNYIKYKCLSKQLFHNSF